MVRGERARASSEPMALHSGFASAGLGPAGPCAALGAASSGMLSNDECGA